MKLLYLVLGGCASFLFGVCQDVITTPDSPAITRSRATTNSVDLVPAFMYHRFDITLQVVTSQCIQANIILGDYEDEGSTLSYDDEDYAIVMWILEVSISKRIQNGQRTQSNMTLKLPPSLRSTTIAPLSTGAEVTVKFGYKTREDIRESMNKVKRVTLPGIDEQCEEPYGQRWFPCSECVCTSRAYGGTACKDPMFYPVNVFALPGSSQSLHVQWEFNETDYRRDFNSVGLSMAGFMVNISQVSSREPTFIASTIVPPSERSFVAEDGIEPGVTYEVVVSTVARCRVDNMESMVHANSPPTRALVQVADGTLEPCHLPTTELREREAQTSLAAGVTIITVVVVVIVGLLVASFVIGATCVCVRKRRSLQNMIVATSPESHSRDPNTPRLEWNPSYGQLPLDNHTSTHNTSTSNGLYAVLEGREDEQRSEESRTEFIDSTGNGTEMYDYITPPRM